MHTRMPPYFLFIGIGFDTHLIKQIGYMRPTLISFFISDLIMGDFVGLIALKFYQTGFALG